MRDLFLHRASFPGRDRLDDADRVQLRALGGERGISTRAPLSASSGQTQRHRLNRGGNRQLNWALHFIALVQCRISPDAKAYMARQREAGKSNKEAMRCLKRQLSNVVYRHLVADARRDEQAA